MNCTLTLYRQSKAKNSVRVVRTILCFCLRDADSVDLCVSLCGGQILLFCLCVKDTFRTAYIGSRHPAGLFSSSFKNHVTQFAYFTMSENNNSRDNWKKCLLLLHLCGMGASLHCKTTFTVTDQLYQFYSHETQKFQKITKISSTLSSNKSSKINNFLLLFYC